jgi:hypothetical protein
MNSAGGVWTAVQQNAASQVSTPISSWDGALITCPADGHVEYTSNTSSNSADFEITCNTDYPGGELSSLQSPTLQGCVEACTDNVDCVGLAYLGVGCYLKSSLQLGSVNPGVI